MHPSCLQKRMNVSSGAMWDVQGKSPPDLQAWYRSWFSPWVLLSNESLIGDLLAPCALPHRPLGCTSAWLITISNGVATEEGLGELLQRWWLGFVFSAKGQLGNSEQRSVLILGCIGKPYEENQLDWFWEQAPCDLLCWELTGNKAAAIKLCD